MDQNCPAVKVYIIPEDKSLKAYTATKRDIKKGLEKAKRPKPEMEFGKEAIKMKKKKKDDKENKRRRSPR